MKRLTKVQTMEVIRILEDLYPDAKAELDHTNPFELLIATILSAQCTDVRVNKVTKEMFKDLKSPEDYVFEGQEKVAERIKTCGFYNSKSKNIIGACEMLIDKFDGKVPETIEELMELPGVGRKTANVVASNSFDIPAIAVDTHVFRVSNRIGIAKSDDVLGTEKQLMRMIDKDMWTKAHHIIIFHGRRMCKARRPLCEQCPITEYCNYYKGNNKK